MNGPKARHVARLVRERIEAGGYPDGHHLVQGRLAAEFGVGRPVVWQALAELRDDGLVSRVMLSGQPRYLVNATHASRQVQRLLNWLEHRRSLDLSDQFPERR